MIPLNKKRIFRPIITEMDRFQAQKFFRKKMIHMTEKEIKYFLQPGNSITVEAYLAGLSEEREMKKAEIQILMQQIEKMAKALKGMRRTSRECADDFTLPTDQNFSHFDNLAKECLWEWES